MSLQSIQMELTLADLPFEILCNIFSKLPLSHMSKVASVCKDWNELSKVEILWKKNCLERNCTVKLKESWHKTAQTELPQLYFFKNILNRIPSVSITVAQHNPRKEDDATSIAEVEVFWEKLKKGGPRYEVVNQEGTLSISNAKGELLLHSLSERKRKPIVYHQVFDDRLTALDSAGTLYVFDLVEGRLLREYSNNEGINTQIEIVNDLSIIIALDGDILINVFNRLNQQQTITSSVHVHYLSESLKDFSFQQNEIITGAALRRNILTLNTFKTKNTIYFIDLDQKLTQTYSDQNPVFEMISKDEMIWLDRSLFILRTQFLPELGSGKILERWNFAPNQINRRESLQLPILNE